MGMEADVVVIGAGLAGLVAAGEAVERGRSVILLDQEPDQNMGAQAFWSLGGLFMIDTPEQRRMGIKDSPDLAHDDWMGAAGFDGPQDAWPRKWAEAYLAFAHQEKRAWLKQHGFTFFPIVGWAERGGTTAGSFGGSVPRFHLTWGCGPGVVEPFARRVRRFIDEGRITWRPRHRVDSITVRNGAVTGVAGAVLAEDAAPRGAETNRDQVGEFEAFGEVVVASGGIGGDHDLVRRFWPKRMGRTPRRMLSGVPAHVDGRMLAIAEGAGASVINKDRLWTYVEGVENHDPIWPNHGIRILPGPSSMWFDALGARLEPPFFPGFDTLATATRILSTGHDHSWFILTQKIIKKEFALSGSEQNPDLTNRDWRLVAGRAFGPKATGPVEAFKEKGVDFAVADDLDRLVSMMNDKTEQPLLDPAQIRRQIELRDRQMTNDFAKDAQVMAITNARQFFGDRLIRCAKPHKILDPKNGPLIAVKLNILTRKTLGGLETDLSGRALDGKGEPIPGLYAAGEAAGFGGGGVHGHRSLEGTFLGGCLFSGRIVGRAVG